MRRYWRKPLSARTLRGTELLRLLTGIVMLGVVYMLIVRAGDPDTWRWLTGEGRRAAAVPAGDSGDGSSPRLPQGVVVVEGADPSASSQELPEATGPTDEDSEQVDAAREEFQVVTDGTLTLEPEEMVVYDRLVAWVYYQSFEQMARRATPGRWYADLYGQPNKHRGELFVLDLDVRMVRNVGENRDGVLLHEAWGATPESRGRLYDLVVLDYPSGPVGDGFIRQRAKFVGYFLKLQGYEPASAKPGQPPEKAPMLIGRLRWEPNAAVAVPDNTGEFVFGAVLLAAMGAGWAVWLLLGRFRRRSAKPRPLLTDPSGGKKMSIEQWLDQPSEDADNSTDQGPFLQGAIGE